MFDPIKLAKETGEIACKGNEKKYYRFRSARFYGGIATADCVGCCLRCCFCWSWNVVTDPKERGRFYTPEKVAHNLLSIAEKFGFSQLRISGNEPTIGKQHFLKVLDNLKGSGKKFITETNGILLGHDKSYAKELRDYNFVHVRVSIKGASEGEFSKLTGAKPDAFNYQIDALKNLAKAGVSCHPSVMVSFSSEENLEALRERLGKINPAFADFEVEELMFFGNVKERLEKAGIKWHGAYEPGKAPERLI